MIEVKSLNKKFDGDIILNDINATFDKGLVNMIIGKSGSGKTVLLKCIVGLVPPSSGQIMYGDSNLLAMRSSEVRRLRRNIGMLFQGSALFDSRTVLENVMFPLDMFSRINLRERKKRAEFCLERVGLANSANLYPSEISGGMMKRAAIARAIALNPKYLFCDEPNSGLDPKTAQLIDELIKDITEDYKMTTIVVSHDMNSVINIGDKIIFLNEGIKEWEGSKSEVMDSKNEKLNDFVFASDLFKKIKVADDIISEDKKG
ncbi:MAG TPA: ATP-binding cassette domain-containing protein [Bacteroidales bacterium]|nr:ATP-binding cassette domain-containing protein [Bacteroidales bacterium]